MAYSVAQLTARVREHNAGFPPDDATNDAGDLIALAIVNEAHRDVVKHGNVMAEESATVLVTDGVARYDLDPTIVRVLAADWHDRAGVDNGYPLRETSIDELDHRTRGWRSLSRGAPYCYYRDGERVGFFLTPNRTSLAGYPCVVLSVLRAAPFDSVTDLLPASVIDLDAYVEACKFRYALRADPGAVGLGAQLSQSALQGLRRDMQGTLIRQKPTVRARFPRIR